jgi:uncharacterized protein YdhG (YjbR/CyaY superfamily)
VAQSTAVDEYIAAAPASTQAALVEIRRLVHLIVPDAGEKISYRIPTFTLDGKYFAYVAGFDSHVSIYPVTNLPGLDDEIAPYRSGKGTLRFPLDRPLPCDLIERVVAALSQRRRG